MYSVKKLSNGITVVGQKLDAFSSLSVGIWVKTGSANEASKEFGMAHFIEHMLFKGTHKRSAWEIASEMDNIGGILNAFTSKECTCYHARVASDQLATALDLLCDIVFFSKFDEAELEKEKGVVLEEIHMVEDSPDDLVHEILCEAYYQDYPLSHPILGSSQSVSSFKREDLLRFHKKHYSKNNIVIAVAGGFDFDEFFNLCEEYTSKYDSDTGETYSLEKYIPKAQCTAYKKKPIEQAHLALVFPGFDMDHPLLYAVSLFNNIFGGGMSSRLFQRIREDMGLAYDVYSHPSSYTATGTFTIYAAVNPDRAESALEAILHEVQQARNKGITDEEFERGKNQLRGNYVLGLESTTARMNAIGRSMTLLGKLRKSEDTLKSIEAITIDDVAQAIETVTDFQYCGISAVGNVNEKLLDTILQYK